LEQLVGYDKWERIPFAEDRRSGTRRSGIVVWHLDRDGLYRIRGAAESSRASLGTECFLRDGNSVRILDREDLDGEMTARYPAEASVVKAAAQRRMEAEEERRAAAEERRKHATAVYDADPHAVEVSIEDGIVRVELAAQVTEAGEYFGGGGSFRCLFLTSDGGTANRTPDYVPGGVVFQTPLPEDGFVGVQATSGAPDASLRCFLIQGGAVIEVDDVRWQARRDELTAHRDGDLPQLDGTPRQVAWARDIRAKLARSNPNAPELMRIRKVKTWIERRHSL
jgi:hypothetical protein